MKKLTIKKERFLDWYFSFGQDQENEIIKTELANTIISQLYKSGFGTINLQDLFNDCNKGSIRLYFTCQYEMLVDFFDIELQDLNETFEINLIN